MGKAILAIREDREVREEPAEEIMEITEIMVAREIGAVSDRTKPDYWMKQPTISVILLAAITADNYFKNTFKSNFVGTL